MESNADLISCAARNHLPCFSAIRIESNFSSIGNMPYYDEGESSSSESTTPEEVKVTEWLILGANLQELSLELADFTSKCSQVTPILSCMQTKPDAFQQDVSR